MEIVRGKVRPGRWTRIARVLILSIPFMFQHMTMKKEYLRHEVAVSVRLEKKKTEAGQTSNKMMKTCSQNCHKPLQVMFHTRFQDPWAWAGRSASWTEWPGAAAR